MARLKMECDTGTLEIPDEWIKEWATTYAGGRSELIVREIKSCIQWLRDKGVKQKKGGARQRLGNWIRLADEKGRFKPDEDERRPYKLLEVD